MRRFPILMHQVRFYSVPWAFYSWIGGSEQNIDRKNEYKCGACTALFLERKTNVADELKIVKFGLTDGIKAISSPEQ